MNYSDSLRYLDSFLNLERISLTPSNRSWNLDRMRLLLDWFGHPEKDLLTVLIAGTKGKGSTGFFLESMLCHAGYRAGFYSSPHLQDPRERIRLNGRLVSKDLWISGIREIRKKLSHRKPPRSLGDFTYFEIMTLLAVLIFKRKRVQAAVFEVGMGGRLDATNALNPKIVLLTPIHLDHEAILGNTIAKIAGEKAAIIRRRVHTIVAPQPQEAMKKILDRTLQQKAILWQMADSGEYRLGLEGDYQKVNAGMALRAAFLLRDYYGLNFSEKAFKNGLETRQWPGRMELFKGRPDVLLDGAHNPISIEALVRNLGRLFRGRRRVLVFGTSRDKKAGAMLKALSRAFDQAILTQAPNPRSYEPGTLLLQARGLFERLFPCRDITEAVTLAKKMAGLDGLVVVTGSFYVIGEARKKFKSAQTQDRKAIK